MAFLAAFILLVAVSASASPQRSAEEVAENARWLVHSSSWGFLTTLDTSTKAPVGDVLSFSDGAVGNSTGRLFFYLMGDYAQKESNGDTPATLTISQAGFLSSCSSTYPASAVRDPEDPRCGRLSAAGILREVSGADEEVGKSALFARHPQMRNWPPGHHFKVHELLPSDLWLLDSFGGGLSVKIEDFRAAAPKHTTPWAEPAPGAGAAEPQGDGPPPWSHVAQRARWLVYHSTWGSVGTKSVRLDGMPWGNVRSVADGVGKNSTGLPVLYLPTPDPTAVDLAADSQATLSLSEAALAERVSRRGPCNGADTEDPTCARIILLGTLRALADKEVAQAELNLKQRHPKAPWLAHGGAHTGGKYYTIDLQSIVFLDFYGGPAPLTVSDYLAASPVADYYV